MDRPGSTRRRYLTGLGSAVVAAVAGCSESSDGGTATDTTASPQGRDTETQRERDAETSAEYVGLATDIATRTERWRRDRSERLVELGQSDVIRGGSQSARNELLRSEVASLPGDVHRLHLVERDSWNITASSDPIKVDDPLNTREAPWRTSQESYGENGVFVSEPTEALLVSLVSFVTPVDAESGVELLLVLQSDMDTLAGTFPDHGAGVYTQLVDSQGRIVARTQGVDQLSRNDGSLETYTVDPQRLDPLRNGLNGETGFVQGSEINALTAPDHDEYAIAFAPVETEDWVVFVHVPVSELR